MRTFQIQAFKTSTKDGNYHSMIQSNNMLIEMHICVEMYTYCKCTNKVWI